MTFIKPIEKIALLSKIITNAGFKFEKTKSILPAIELAKTIDELHIFKVMHSELDIDLAHFLPEHWKQKIEFLKIVLDHWPKILSDIGLYDTPIVHPVKLPLLAPTEEIINIKSIVETENVFEETNYIKETILHMSNKNICIFCPNNTFKRFFVSQLFTKEVQEAELEEISTIFNTTNTQDSRYILDLLNLELHNVKHNNIEITKEVNALLNTAADIIFFPTMNNALWDCQIHSSYWLHSSVRKTLGLPNTSPREEIFNTLIHLPKQFYISYIKKSNGINIKKHNLLTSAMRNYKLEIQIYNPKTEVSNQVVSENLSEFGFSIEKKLSARDIEILSANSYDFFIKKTLNLSPISYNENLKTLRILCNDLIKHFIFSNDKGMRSTLNSIANIDFYRYQHCKNIMSYLDKHYKFLKEFCNINSDFDYNLKLENDKSITILSKDNILINGELFVFKMFESCPSVNEVINGSVCAPMVDSLVIQKNLGINSVRKIQICSLNGIGSTPIETTTIEISNITVDLFEQRLRKILSNCIIDTTEKSEKFRHFKRIQ